MSEVSVLCVYTVMVIDAVGGWRLADEVKVMNREEKKRKVKKRGATVFGEGLSLSLIIVGRPIWQKTNKCHV